MDTNLFNKCSFSLTEVDYLRRGSHPSHVLRVIGLSHDACWQHITRCSVFLILREACRYVPRSGDRRNCRHGLRSPIELRLA